MAKRTKQFVKLDYELLDNEIWQGLNKSAQHVYVYFKRARNKRERGKVINHDNGYIKFGYSDCPGISKNGFVNAIMELRVNGFIKLIKAGQFPQKGSKGQKRKAVYSLIDKWQAYSRNE